MSKSKPDDQSEETVSQRIQALNRQMERHAESGQWQQLTEDTVRRNAMLADVPAGEKSATYLSAQESTQRILALAEQAQFGVTERLSILQHGRRATDKYRENS